MKHKCPVNECQEELNLHIFMCKAHWNKVSPRNKNLISNYWKMFLAEPLNNVAKEKHKYFCEKAVKEVNAKESPNV